MFYFRRRRWYWGGAARGLDIIDRKEFMESVDNGTFIVPPEWDLNQAPTPGPILDALEEAEEIAKAALAARKAEIDGGEDDSKKKRKKGKGKGTSASTTTPSRQSSAGRKTPTPGQSSVGG